MTYLTASATGRFSRRNNDLLPSSTKICFPFQRRPDAQTNQADLA